MKKISTLILFFLTVVATAQINAKLVRHVTVSDSQIAFVHGGDIWIMPIEGGQALQLTHSQGEESFPKFSPDGSELAFSASYNGNLDVYVMPSKGGVPLRLTYGSHPDRMVDWHPNGEQILFASRREAGTPRVNQFYSISKEGGMPQRLNVPYGELASYSDDGKQLAYITKITENYPFKRYRGGLTSDVIIYDLENDSAENITNNLANDGKPNWVGNKIYFLSDRDDLMRRNIWAYDVSDKSIKPITSFKDFDITYVSASKKNLVFEAGGTLYLLDVNSEKYKEINVFVANDLSKEIPVLKDVSKQISNMSAAPGGKRIVFEARGELFDVPVKDGYIANLTNSSGAFDRNPSWSPNGEKVAYWSDSSGENEIHMYDVKSRVSSKMTSIESGFGYRLHWSPNNEKISFIDEKNDIQILDVGSKTLEKIDNVYLNVGHGSRFGFTISWSPDSKWIAYNKTIKNINEAIFIYSLTDKKVHKVTSGYYADYDPVFSTDGKYLYYLTDRTYNAAYSGLGDGTWIYPNNTNIAALSLTKDVAYPLHAKNDEVKIKPDKKEEEKGSDKEASKIEVKIDFEEIESRIAILPVKPGNYGAVLAFKGKVGYYKFPNTGDSNAKPMLGYYDLKEREEKKILDNVQAMSLSADGKLLLVRSAGKYGVIKPEPDQKIKEPIPTNGLKMNYNAKQEWHQIFNDTWRRYRDFFYDENMQQVDWDALKIRYGSLINDARTRWDVTNLQSNLSAELSAGHTYTFGGDNEQVQRVNSGFLGIDWELSNGKYGIKRIVKPALWDTEVRSPFDRPGMKVVAGNYILSVNGVDLDITKDPYAAFEGLSGKTVTLSISSTGDEADAKDIVVKCLSGGQEATLRYHEWLEQNRKMIDKLSDGKLGYVYMSNTGGQGQLELVKMFYGQLDKEGFVIDERFNGGGQLADRFLELLKRPVIYNLYWRHGAHQTHPIKTNTGPMGMLINGWAGSGGDGLPWAFREMNGGPIVGERTLGILVGPATGHSLIDGGGITVPGARLYLNNGSWFAEGEGVQPDFKVWDDPNMLLKGRDPQMEKVVEEVLKLIKDNPVEGTPPPKLEDRTAKGMNKN